MPCRECIRLRQIYWNKNRPGYRANRRHITGEAQAFNQFKECSMYLGVHIGENTAYNILNNIFINVERMSINNKGYDFVCDHIKIDVKSSKLKVEIGRNPYWHFNTERSTIPDRFLCLGFDTNEKLVHKWLIPNKIVVGTLGFRITNTKKSLDKWREFELI